QRMCNPTGALQSSPLWAGRVTRGSGWTFPAAVARSLCRTQSHVRVPTEPRIKRIRPHDSDCEARDPAGHDATDDIVGHLVSASQPEPPFGRVPSGSGARLPFLVLADHGDGDAGMGGDPPQTSCAL